MGSSRTRSDTSNELQKVKQSATSPKTLSKADEEALAKQRSAAVTATANATVEKALSGVVSTQISTTAALNSVSKALTDKLGELHQLNLAIEAKQKELETLHGKDVVASSISDLLEEYDGKKDTLEKDIIDLREKFEQERKTLQVTLAEEQAFWKKAREREEEQYKYDTEQAHKKDRDAEADYKKGFEETLAARKAVIDAAEKELTELREFKTKEPENTEKAIKAAVGKAEALQKRDFDHEKALTKATTDAAIALEKQTSATLDKRVKDLEQQVKDLQAQLVSAQGNVKDIAQSAVQSAAAAKAQAEQVTLAGVRSPNEPPRR